MEGLLEASPFSLKSGKPLCKRRSSPRSENTYWLCSTTGSSGWKNMKKLFKEVLFLKSTVGMLKKTWLSNGKTFGGLPLERLELLVRAESTPKFHHHNDDVASFAPQTRPDLVKRPSHYAPWSCPHPHCPQNRPNPPWGGGNHAVPSPSQQRQTRKVSVRSGGRPWGASHPSRIHRWWRFRLVSMQTDRVTESFSSGRTERFERLSSSPVRTSLCSRKTVSVRPP